MTKTKLGLTHEARAKMAEVLASCGWSGTPNVFTTAARTRVHEAALAYARACGFDEKSEAAALEVARAAGWSSPAETAGFRQGAHEHVHCRVELQHCRERVDALEIVLAGVIGAARADDGTRHWGNISEALDRARAVLGSAT